MAILVVGGSGKHVGKTTLVCGLIAALVEFRWTAVKVTDHDHGKPDPVWEETAAGPETDTARYLEAGACRALLVAKKNGRIPLRALRKTTGPGAHLILESNSILSQLRQDLALAVLAPDANVPGKPSFSAFLRRADAMVVRAGAAPSRSRLHAVSPLFELEHFARISPPMLAWLRMKLQVAPHR